MQAPKQSAYGTESVDPSKAHFTYCSLPFLRPSRWFPTAEPQGLVPAEVQPEEPPTPREHGCSRAVVKNFTRKAQSWHKTATVVCAQVPKATCPAVSAWLQPQFVTISRYHRVPIACRNHRRSEPGFVSLNPSAELRTSIDNYSREEKEQVSNQVSVTKNGKKKKKWNYES